MIRPSALSLAGKCGHALSLAEQFPESSSAAERGTELHARLERYINTRVHDDMFTPIFATFPAHVKAESEAKVSLADPDSGEVISAGTADVVLTHDDGSVTCIDLKTGNPDRVDEPNGNLQLAVYGLAAAIERGAPRYRVGIYFTEWPPLILSKWFVDGADYADVLARIRGAMDKPRDVPVVGPHCDRCYVRKHCRGWATAAAEAETELAKFDPAELTTGEKVGRLVLAIQAHKEKLAIMEKHCQDYALRDRVIVDGKEWAPGLVNGRRSVSIDRVEAAGLLPQLEDAGCVSKGGAYTRFGWRNVGHPRARRGLASDWKDGVGKK